MLLRLLSMMATTAQRSVSVNSTRTRPSLITRTKKGPLKASLPTLGTTGTAERPKSFSDVASLPGQRSGRKSANGLPSSANAVNQRRNVRQRKSLTTSQSDTSLNKKLQNLSISDKKKPPFNRASSSSSAPIRKSSSASGGTCKSLEDVARLILTKRCKNIVVMAGAGISTPSGIPDFRTPGSGLYDNLQQYKIPFPEAIFDIDFFQKDPRPFFALAKELYPGGQYRPNYVHYFCRMLHEKGLLLRMYTQNIDGLERLAGIPANKLVEAHGTFLKASCTRCGHPHDTEEVKSLISTNRIPNCSLHGCTGKVKPDIVFFGEDLPKRFFYYLKDFPLCDLVIIMGTSLEVYPFAGIVNSARGYVPRLLINRDLVGPFKKRPGSSSSSNGRSSNGRFNDLGVTGDLVECVQKFVRVLGWKKAVEDLIKAHETLLDTQSEQILHGTSDQQSPNGVTPNGVTPNGGASPDGKPANSGGNGKPPIDNRHSPINRNGQNGRGYHTVVSEKTVTLPNSSSRASPLRSRPPSRNSSSLALPRIGSDKPKNGSNNWADKVGRQYRSRPDLSSSSSESSSDDDDDDDSSSDDS